MGHESKFTRYKLDRILLTGCHDSRMDHGRRPFMIKRLDVGSHTCNVGTRHRSSRDNRVSHTPGVSLAMRRWSIKRISSEDLHSWCCYIWLQFAYHFLSQTGEKENQVHKSISYISYTLRRSTAMVFGPREEKEATLGAV